VEACSRTSVDAEVGLGLGPGGLRPLAVVSGCDASLGPVDGGGCSDLPNCWR
jgi:hypothetical protein